MMDALSKNTGTDTLIAAGEVVELRFRDNARALSLRSAKLFHLLLDYAGAKACEDIEHRIPVAELNFPHVESEALIECVRDLFGTTVELTYKTASGAMRVSGGPLLSFVDRPLDWQEGDTAELVFRLSPTLRMVLESSNHWAALSRSAVLAFESRYALRLYELMTLRGGLIHKNTETFDLDDLRRRLGVPPGKLAEWYDLRRVALEPAIAEVNQLSGLEVSYEAIKRGRRVDRVALTWAQRDTTGRAGVARELAYSRSGRKARRDGTVEDVAPSPAPEKRLAPRLAFPEHGTIRHGTERRIWLELAEKHAARLPGRHLPDLGGLSDQFRAFCDDRNIPLDAPTIEKTFITFCQKYRPLMGG